MRFGCFRDVFFEVRCVARFLGWFVKVGKILLKMLAWSWVDVIGSALI